MDTTVRGRVTVAGVAIGTVRSWAYVPGTDSTPEQLANGYRLQLCSERASTGDLARLADIANRYASEPPPRFL